MNIKKKSIAVKLSRRKSKNGYFQVRLKNGRFAWLASDVLTALEDKEKLAPHWSLDCII